MEAYWESSSELKWELVSGILGGGIGNLINVEFPTLSGNLSATLLGTPGPDPFHKPKIRNAVGRGVCCEPHPELNGNFSRTFCWELHQEPYRLFGNHIAKPIGNLSTTSVPKPRIQILFGTLNIEPYIWTLSETLSNLETPIRNLAGNLKPETRNRELIGNLVGNRESSGKLPRHAPKHLLTAEDPKL